MRHLLALALVWMFASLLLSFRSRKRSARNKTRATGDAELTDSAPGAEYRELLKAFHSEGDE